MSGTVFAPQAQDIAPFWLDRHLPVVAGTGAAVGAAVDEALAENVGPAAFRSVRRRLADNAASQLEEGEQPGWSGPLLSGEEAQSRFGIPGHLSFTSPLSEFAARELHDLKRAEIARRDVLSRSQGGAVEWTGRILGSLAAGMADPVNVASAFVPVVGQARAAAWTAQAGTRLARAGVAARIGAIEGAAGAAMLEPAAMLFAAQEQRDHGMVDSVLNVAFGAGLGAGLHAAGRGLADWRGGWRPGDAGSPAFGTPAAAVHEAQVRAATAAIVQGEPVQADTLGRLFGAAYREDLLGTTARVGPDAAGVYGIQRPAGPALTPAALDGLQPAQQAAAMRMEGRPVTLADMDARQREEALAQPGVRAALDVARALRDGEATPQGERSLVAFLVREGGLRDDGGDLSATMGTTRARPGLANRNGMSLDEAAQKARAAGYFDEAGPRRQTEAGAPQQRGGAEGQDYDSFGPRELLAAVDDELRGKARRYGRTEDARAREFAAAVDDLDAMLEPHGLTATSDEASIIAALTQGTTDAAPGRSMAELDAEYAAWHGTHPDDPRSVMTPEARAALLQQVARQTVHPADAVSLGRVDAAWARVAGQGEAAMVPYVPARAAAPEAAAAARTLTGPDLRARFGEGADGAVDMQAAPAAVVREVEEALARGAPVTLTVEGKAVPIVRVDRGMMADAQGQRWGTMSLFTGTDARNQLEIGPAAAAAGGAPAPSARLAPPEARFTADGPDGFVRRADGSTDLGRVPEGVEGWPAGPIRLARGWHDQDGRGRGLLHIEARREGQISGDVAEFVARVAEGFTEVRANREGTLALVELDPTRTAKRDPHGMLVVAIRRTEGGWYEVVTGGRFKQSYFGKAKKLWEAEHTAASRPSGLVTPSSPSPRSVSGAEGPSSARGQSAQNVGAGPRADKAGVLIPKDLVDQMAVNDEILAQHVAAGRIAESDLAVIRAADDAVAQAQNRAAAFDAAAACIISKGV